MKLRINFAENNGAKHPESKCLCLIEPDYKILVQTASNKMKINKKNIRFFVGSKTKNSQIGNELNETNFNHIIETDIILVVSNGENYKGATSSINITELEKIDTVVHNLTKPPYSSLLLDNISASNSNNTNANTYKLIHIDTPEKDMSDDIYSNDVQKQSHHSLISNIDSTNNDNDNSIFPVLEGNVLQLVKESVKNCPDIKFTEMADGYIVFDYKNAPEFPNTNELHHKIQRECRGLIISSSTGKVLARRFHKFFNVDERPESSLNCINLNGASILEKIDGSLVTPILIDDHDDNDDIDDNNDNEPNLIWATRKVKDPDVEKYISLSENEHYNKLAIYYIKLGYTPIFEWCHPKKTVGVLTYDNYMLVLLAVRHNITGKYLSYGEIRNIIDNNFPNVQLVNSINTSNWLDLNAIVNKSHNREGVVICLPNGLRYKLKCQWYINVAKSIKYGKNERFLVEYVKLNGSLEGVPENRIWYTCLLNQDNVVSDVINLLKSSNEIKKLTQFNCHIQKQVTKIIERFWDWVKECQHITNKKHIIIKFAEMHGYPYQITSAVLDDNKNKFELFIRKYLIDLNQSRGIHFLEKWFQFGWNTKNNESESNNTEHNNSKIPDYQIYCDLDGVLADFESGVKKWTGFSISEQTTDKMWKSILNKSGFFENLDWMPDGQQLIDTIKNHQNGNLPIILTGLPRTCRNNVAKEKKRWCQSKFETDNVNVITCMSVDKYQYASKNRILIDDMHSNGVKWQTHGGIFIHHTSVESTIKTLNKIMSGEIDPYSETHIDTTSNDTTSNNTTSNNTTSYNTTSNNTTSNSPEYTGIMTIDNITWLSSLPVYTKTLYILRGLPGSGKSTLSKLLKHELITVHKHPDNIPICSADNFLINTKGQYEWHPSKLENAHKMCFNLADQNMQNDIDSVIIDNTNTRAYEYGKYIELAKKHKYKVCILTLDCSLNNLQKIHKRCIHNVPYRDLLNLKNRWEHADNEHFIKPFFDDIGSSNTNELFI
jgi:predicted kinase